MSSDAERVLEDVALAIHEARFAHPTHPRDPEPWDRTDREYAFRLASRALPKATAPLEARIKALERERDQWIAAARGYEDRLATALAYIRALPSTPREETTE
jgi:hypothetical protein